MPTATNKIRTNSKHSNGCLLAPDTPVPTSPCAADLLRTAAGRTADRSVTAEVFDLFSAGELIATSTQLEPFRRIVVLTN